GLLGLALLADGRFGQGWNGIGAESYLGIAGQGVSGLWPAVGLQADWPGQMQAQLAGVAAEALFSFLLATLTFGALAALLHVGQRERQPLASPGAMLNDEC
ncbi:MAG: hypothetical protein WBV59_18800, partial [Anaerolineae bacterium]